LKRIAALLAALGLAACAQPETAAPALWEVTGPGGAHGYLFGTIHSLDEDVAWRSPVLEQAFAAADTLAVEAAGIEDAEATARIWQGLAMTPGQPPIAQRVAGKDAANLAKALKKAGLDEHDFANVETWAAALRLANALNTENGEAVDLALLRDGRGKRVVELEGVAGQLAIFDRLPPADQSDLLAAVAGDALADPDGPKRLAQLWRTGDIVAIAAETRRGMLADPELREALLVGRNRAWAARIDQLLKARSTPFVAVGAAHMASEDGLPTLLAARGYIVKRVQ
jgi:uncharacterized protein YbaP (TraB family)